MAEQQDSSGRPRGSFREDMQEFHKFQAEREKKESVGFDGKPRRVKNIARGIPLRDLTTQRNLRPEGAQPRIKSGDQKDSVANEGNLDDGSEVEYVPPPD